MAHFTRRATRALAAGAAAAALLAAGQAAANNDPHRIFLPQGPFDIAAGVCAFPVHVDVPTDREYAKVQALADGTLVIKVTGALKLTLTNAQTGKTITVNASGPGTEIAPPGSSVVSIDTRGRGVFFVTNGAAFGLPNFMATSGPFVFSIDTSNDTLASVSRMPSTVTDLCAALG